MDTYPVATVPRITIAIAVAALAGLLLIGLFYAVGGPFGTLNDIFVALEGVLSVALVLALQPFFHARAPRLSWFAFTLGAVGGILVPIGSGLVVSDITGWFLAGLVTTFGYACIGVWLLCFNYAVLRSSAFPRNLARLGLLAGWVSAVGLLAAPAILAGSDDMDSAAWFARTALFVGGFGWNILYPLWCLWLGRRILSKRLDLLALIAPF